MTWNHGTHGIMVIMVESLHGINIAVIDIKVFGVIDILCSLNKQP